ncbi:MAG: ATP-dependent DNA helicase RecG [Gammaproteobacteria bacterium]|nr:ATP-dependent DNA helicase RecG [Gammaproteobacteria bacterium]
MNQDRPSLNSLHCIELKGVGPKIAEHLKRLGIVTVQDLLFHLPLRYEDRTHFKPLAHLKPGDHVQVEGTIAHVVIKEGRRKSLVVRIEEESAYLLLRFFHFNTAQYNLINRPGQRVHCYGEVKWNAQGYEMIHPEYYFVKEDQPLTTSNTLTAIYPTTEGLHQYSLRRLTDQALLLLEKGGELSEHLPVAILEELALPGLTKAVHTIHRPPSDTPQETLHQGLHPAQQRLVFEELLAHQLSLARIRMRTRSLQAPKITTQSTLPDQFLMQLPFQLTHAQKRVIHEIVQDLQSGSPMLRLVQGDVGSGKTVVAAAGALYLISAGFQVAIMAPTELLAEQHYKNFLSWFNPLEINVAWLTSAIKGKKRDEIAENLLGGQLQIVIGTHALFQKEILFKNLGLIIIDEQHRFGVHQRLALLNKGMWGDYHPHQLIMSATPIPRTLAMTAYADLDCSTIDELPPGRTPIKTVVLPNSKRQELIHRIKDNCLAGAQAYWVCTLIEESEILECQAAEEITKELTACLPELRIGLVHGRMKSKEKEQIMFAFNNRTIDLLVATTVIEVGVDVPNASLMVIENAERLGLAQLHQLRGRVGRGSIESHCVLLYQPPLSRLASERLSVLRSYSDGFIIAQKDLELRGPGEVLGTRQTGLIQFKIADLTRDQHLLQNVQRVSEVLLHQFPENADLIVQRWLADNHLLSEV